MIGIFDSGLGGLTITKALLNAFPDQRFTYLGDQANAPYGNMSSAQVLHLTTQGVDYLFHHGCKLVILGCNTATAIAGRHLQTEWLPHQWPGRNVLGIIAPTVEAATQTPWNVREPVYPQKYNQDRIAVFATRQTISSQVYEVEIAKRCPHAQVINQPCPSLAGAIEGMATRQELENLIHTYVSEMLEKTNGAAPHWAILGCTHYPMVADIFHAYLPPQTRMMDQPQTVANSLHDYLGRHPQYLSNKNGTAPDFQLFTTADPQGTKQAAARFLDIDFHVERCSY